MLGDAGGKPNPIWGFLHLGIPGPGHRIQLQLINQHVMSSEGSWRRIQMLMITARLRSAGKGRSSRVGRHHRSWLDLFYFLMVLPKIVSISLTFPQILQVPGPLTPEMEARQALRKREQKAARRQREEQQRKQREQEKREQEEQQRFAALSDREKVRLEVFSSIARLP